MPPVRIDADTGWAWCGDRRLELAPRLFDLLRHLTEHPNRLLTKDDLFAAVWGDTVVGDAALASCIRDLRKALADSSQTPRYIETVHRRGFRFIGPVVSATAATSAPAAHALVGRDAELARLDAAFATAAAGRRRLVFVTGEPGIGKTSLVEAFLARVGASARVGRGQCVEHYGAGEAYMPLLEALGRLAREPGGDDLVQVLARYAPTWLAQLPALLDDEALARVQQRAAGATRERMLRELSEAIDAASAQRPLILALEDLHWSDTATVGLLAMLARRRDPARLLVVGTYRPADVAATAHPLGAAAQELQLRGTSEELALGFLGPQAIDDHLARRFPRAAFPASFALRLQERTGGNPLFLVALLDDLVARGHLVEQDGAWTLAVPVERAVSGIPASLSQMVERQIARLAPDEEAVLAAGGVAGVEFSAALAAVDGIAVAAAERVCDTLARRGSLLRAVGTTTWPDGMVAGGYRFVHALHRDGVYARIPTSRRVELHRRIGARLAEAFAANPDAVAGEVAMHFEEGHDVASAVPWRRRAAELALAHHGYAEAAEHATRGLAIVAELPNPDERAPQELMLHLTLGAALVATRGWGADEVGDAYARARELCGQLGVALPLFPVLRGLSTFYVMRGELAVAHEIATQLLELAEATSDDALGLAAHNTAGMVAFYRGEFAAARTHLETAVAIYDPERHSPARLASLALDHDCGVSATAHLACTLSVQGHGEPAHAAMRQALALAQTIAHPPSQALAWNFATIFYGDRQAPETVREVNEARRRHAAEHGFAVFLWLAEVYGGWLDAEDGRPDDGLPRMRSGLNAYRGAGTVMGTATFLGLLADVYGRAGRTDDALAVVADALAMSARTGMRYWDAELRRIEGTLRVADDPAAADACFVDAMAIARDQGAGAFLLRAATDLARCRQRHGDATGARALLADAIASVSERPDDPRLHAAQTLVAELGGAAGPRRRR